MSSHCTCIDTFSNCTWIVEPSIFRWRSETVRGHTVRHTIQTVDGKQYSHIQYNCVKMSSWRLNIQQGFSSNCGGIKTTLPIMHLGNWSLVVHQLWISLLACEFKTILHIVLNKYLTYQHTVYIHAFATQWNRRNETEKWKNISLFPHWLCCLTVVMLWLLIVWQALSNVLQSTRENYVQRFIKHTHTDTLLRLHAHMHTQSHSCTPKCPCISS